MKTPGGVIELFANILADTPELAAALAGFQLVIDQRPRKLRWQGCAFRLLVWFRGGRRWIQRLEFGFDGRDIGIEQVVFRLIWSELSCSLRRGNLCRLRWQFREPAARCASCDTGLAGQVRRLVDRGLRSPFITPPVHAVAQGDRWSKAEGVITEFVPVDVTRR